MVGLSQSNTFPYEMIVADQIVTEHIRTLMLKGSEMNPLLQITSGWTGLLGPFTLRIDSVAVVLTGFTVELIIHNGQGTPITPGGTVTILDQVSFPGQVTYQPVAADFAYVLGQGSDRRQSFRIHWKVTDGANKVVYFPSADASELGVYRQ